MMTTNDYYGILSLMMTTKNYYCILSLTMTTKDYYCILSLTMTTKDYYGTLSLIFYYLAIGAMYARENSSVIIMDISQRCPNHGYVQTLS